MAEEVPNAGAPAAVPAAPATPAAPVVVDQAISQTHHSANPEGAGERSAPLMARPEWVPEKFFKDGVIDYKGIATENKYLASKAGEPKVAAPKAGEPIPAAGEPKVENKPALIPAVIPGIEPERVTAYTGEITKDGKLSDTSYTELAAKGYPKAVVDVYLAGLTRDAAVQQAAEGAKIAQKESDEIIAGIGGQKALTEMIAWAKVNLNAADLKVYNDSVSSNDPAKVKLAVNGLHHAFTELHGKDPAYVEQGGNGRPPEGSGLVPFNSNAEVVQAMETREYKTSEEYRQKVQARIKISNVFTQSKDYTKVQR